MTHNRYRSLQFHTGVFAWILSSLFTGPILAQQARFQPLGQYIFGDDTTGISQAFGVSDDGKTVVGIATGMGVFSWNETEGIKTLEEHFSFLGNYIPRISADGTTVVGTGETSSGSKRAFRWDLQTDTAELLYPDDQSQATAVSANGQYIAGNIRGKGFRWNALGKTEYLGILPGLPSPAAELAKTYPYDISADGSTIVGGTEYFFTSPPKQQMFSWTEQTGVVGLGFLSGDDRSIAYRTSGDGSVIVGRGLNIAIRWTEETGVQYIGLRQADGISSDGKSVVGWSAGFSEVPASLREASVWSEQDGRQSVQKLLADQSVDLAGWKLHWAWDISSNGSVIVGTGSNPDGQLEAYVATLFIPEPTSCFLFLMACNLSIASRWISIRTTKP